MTTKAELRALADHAIMIGNTTDRGAAWKAFSDAGYDDLYADHAIDIATAAAGDEYTSDRPDVFNRAYADAYIEAFDEFYVNYLKAKKALFAAESALEHSRSTHTEAFEMFHKAYRAYLDSTNLAK